MVIWHVLLTVSGFTAQKDQQKGEFQLDRNTMLTYHLCKLLMLYCWYFLFCFLWFFLNNLLNKYCVFPEQLLTVFYFQKEMRKNDKSSRILPYSKDKYDHVQIIHTVTEVCEQLQELLVQVCFLFHPVMPMSFCHNAFL